MKIELKTGWLNIGKSPLFVNGKVAQRGKIHYIPAINLPELYLLAFCLGIPIDTPGGLAVYLHIRTLVFMLIC